MIISLQNELLKIKMCRCALSNQVPHLIPTRFKLKKLLRSGIAGSKSTSIYQLDSDKLAELLNLCSSCTNLHLYQQ